MSEPNITPARLRAFGLPAARVLARPLAQLGNELREMVIAPSPAPWTARRSRWAMRADSGNTLCQLYAYAPLPISLFALLLDSMEAPRPFHLLTQLADEDIMQLRTHEL